MRNFVQDTLAFIAAVGLVASVFFWAVAATPIPH
jgi:hypothetical protein